MESTSDQAAEGKAVVTVLAAVLERLVKSNANATKNRDGASVAEITKFHALKAPGISIKQYLERIHKYASCSTECFVLALIYIDRLIQNNNFILSDLNVHRVVITAILLAAKFFDDAYYNNAYYAKVGGVLVSEMNSLEVEFLFRINFSLHVKPEVFEKYQDELVSHAVGAGLEAQQQQQQQPQVAQQVRPSDQEVQTVVHTVVQQVQQQQRQHVPLRSVPTDSCPPIFQPVPVVAASGPTQTVVPQSHHPLHQPHSVVVGNVTPSPPPSQQMDVEYTQQHQQQQQATHVSPNSHYIPNQMQPSQQLHTVQQSQRQPQHHHQQSVVFEPYQSGQYQPNQQQYPIRVTNNGYGQQRTSKKQQVLNSNQVMSSTSDVIFATCCPYGGRLTPTTSATGFINTAARVYQ